uniref:Expansin-like EG45 domain-containing protein n=1 Tax=Pseudictyota dubia TaxID=2749911 RepID=A0A7R9ZGR4_9STRA|mmetsp:Transcript_6180/g.10560  ORF Transcript_6180/g.10560 Transcript_6180/m.10560 type:complete len:461 (+) Transcript_6180:223-1605(+)
MRLSPLLLSSWLLASSGPAFRPAAAKKGGSSGGGSGGGRQPSGGGYKPSSPTGSRPSSPSSPSSSYPRPAPTPTIRSPSGPIPSTTKSYYNPRPSYKPLSPTGAPTTRSGGGGFSGASKKVLLGAAAAGAAAGTAVTVAAGYFLYGGRRSSPYCRGTDADRFLSGRCPRGTSTTNHECSAQVPLCAIPESIRAEWDLGPTAPPAVDVLFDGSVCSVVPLAASNGVETNATNASSAEVPAVVERSAAVDGVVGQSGLGNCVDLIAASGGCGSYGTGNMFAYDDDVGTCGCCASTQVTQLGSGTNFSSAVYRIYDVNFDNLGGDAGQGRAAPTHCISGSTMFYPRRVSELTDGTLDDVGGGEATYACECGPCDECGTAGPRYVDWSGPFVVSDNLGEEESSSEQSPRFDPVDACLCGTAEAEVCDAYGTLSSAHSLLGGTGSSFSVQVTIIAAVAVLFAGRR